MSIPDPKRKKRRPHEPPPAPAGKDLDRLIDDIARRLVVDALESAVELIDSCEAGGVVEGVEIGEDVGEVPARALKAAVKKHAAAALSSWKAAHP